MHTYIDHPKNIGPTSSPALPFTTKPRVVSFSSSFYHSIVVCCCLSFSQSFVCFSVSRLFRCCSQFSIFVRLLEVKISESSCVASSCPNTHSLPLLRQSWARSSINSSMTKQTNKHSSHFFFVVCVYHPRHYSSLRCNVSNVSPHRNHDNDLVVATTACCRVGELGS